MAEALTFLYSYILRDVFGYVVPGAIVIAAFVYFFRAERLLAYVKNAWDIKSPGAWFIAVLPCYFVGHAVAGVAFNMWRENPVYSYSPPAVGGDQPHIASLSTFIGAVDKLTNNNAQHSAFRAERERLAVINHMSGIGSAAAGVSMIIGIISLVYYLKHEKMHRRIDYWAVVLLFLFAYGLWLEHRRFRDVQFQFEQDVIHLATLAPQSPAEGPIIKTTK